MLEMGEIGLIFLVRFCLRYRQRPASNFSQSFELVTCHSLYFPKVNDENMLVFEETDCFICPCVTCSNSLTLAYKQFSQ